MAGLSENEPQAVIVAPTGRDSSLICEFLEKQSIQCASYRDLGQAAEQVAESTEVLLIAEEALESYEGSRKLADWLRSQPAWSDLPLIVLLRDSFSARSVRRFLAGQGKTGRSLVLVHRPVRKATLKSAVMAALQDRHRQYQIREHLAEEKHKEEHLRYTQKLESIGVLASGVAHDFNNLLTGILGNASLALEDVPQTHPAHEPLEEICGAGNRAVDLTRQLLAYSGKGQFIIRPIELSDLVQEMSRLIQLAMPKRVQLRLELAPKLPAIEADSSQIQQVVMNLIINGAEAMDPDREGVLTVRTGTQEVGPEDVERNITPSAPLPGSYVYLEVEDTGSGMDEATKARIFDPFFTTKTTGRGLGLSAVLGIIQSHNGLLHLCTRPGQGTTFKAFFPVSEKAAEQRPSTFEEMQHTGAGTVLVIDDEDIVRKPAKAILERAGYSVLVAGTGEEAIEQFRGASDRISAVLLDMTMPGLSGEEVLRELREIRPDVAVILSSGYNESDALQRFHESGLAGFLQKPYTAAALAEKIRTVAKKP